MAVFMEIFALLIVPVIHGARFGLQGVGGRSWWSEGKS
jgi:hypothetical protein